MSAYTRLREGLDALLEADRAQGHHDIAAILDLVQEQHEALAALESSDRGTVGFGPSDPRSKALQSALASGRRAGVGEARRD